MMKTTNKYKNKILIILILFLGLSLSPFGLYAQMVPLQIFDLSRDDILATNKVVDFSPDGEKVLVGGNGIVIFDIETGQITNDMWERPSDIERASFSPDGKIVSLARIYANTQIFDMEQNKITHIYGHELIRPIYDYLYAIAISPDSKSVLSIISSNIFVWDIESEKIIKVINIANTHAGYELTFLSSNLLYISNSVFINYSTNEIFNYYPNIKLSNNTMFSKNGNYLVITEGIFDDSLQRIGDTYILYDSKKHNILGVFKHEHSRIYVESISYDGKKLLICTDENAIIADFDDPSNPKVVRTYPSKDNLPYRIAKFSPDGKKLIMANELKAYLFDISDLYAGVDSSSLHE